MKLPTRYFVADPMRSSSRDPAIELYRILLMLGIVTLHTLQCAGLGFSPLARWVEFCVDGFVFISGWYGIKFGWKKVFKLYALAFWCSAVYALARWLCFESTPWSWGSYVTETVRRAESYWFINAYAVLMCLVPIVNVALESEKSRWVFIPILVVVFGWSFAGMVPGLKGWIPQVAGMGSHTFLTLLGVYIVARLARLENWSSKLSTKRLLICLAILSVLAICNLNKYNSPVAVLLGGTLFMLFSRAKVSNAPTLSKLILLAAPSMLAVYLLHGCGADFIFVRYLLSKIADPWLAALMAIFVVFCVCVLVDILRRGALSATLSVMQKIRHRTSLTYR